MSNSQKTPCHKGINPNPPTKKGAVTTTGQTKSVPKKTNKTKLRSIARRGLFGLVDKHGKGQKTCTCGNGDGGDVVTVGQNSFGRIVTLGVVTCKSVWTCPVCSDGIIAKRKEQVFGVLNGYQYQEQGYVYMLALTLPHTREQSLEQVAKPLKDSWNKFVQSGVYPKIKKEINIQGYIKTMEMTIGLGAGWHPHFHCLFFVKNKLNETERQEIEQRLFDRWALLVEKQGMGKCNRSIFQFTLALNPKQALDYALKGNISAEMTGWHNQKIAKGGGYTPFALLEVIRTSNNPKKVKWAKAMFREYAQFVKGSRYTTYSKDLKKKYNVRDDNDAELLEEEVSTEIEPKVHLSTESYYWLIKKDLWDDFIYAVETDYTDDFLKKYGITKLQMATYDKIPPKTDHTMTWADHLHQQVLQVYYDKTNAVLKERDKQVELEKQQDFIIEEFARCVEEELLMIA